MKCVKEVICLCEGSTMVWAEDNILKEHVVPFSGLKINDKFLTRQCKASCGKGDFSSALFKKKKYLITGMACFVH